MKEQHIAKYKQSKEGDGVGDGGGASTSQGKAAHPAKSKAIETEQGRAKVKPRQAKDKAKPSQRPSNIKQEM